jgi:hypothetical protein
MDTTTHTDPLGELLAAATQTTIRQRIKGREVSWGLEVLDPSAALEVPEVLDMLLSSAQRLLRSRPGAAGNPALAEALEAVRARDSKGRRAEETTTEEAGGSGSASWTATPCKVPTSPPPRESGRRSSAWRDFQDNPNRAAMLDRMGRRANRAVEGSDRRQGLDPADHDYQTSAGGVTWIQSRK